nr:MGMT family protein [uncultured Agathobaculum sp.]
MKSLGGVTCKMNAFDRIYAVVRRIPRGTVATYGQVAQLAGNPRWARVVGYALHANPDPESIPCYRVVTKDGRTSPAFAFGGADMQRALLEADGIGFLPDGRVDMANYCWEGLYDD